MSLDEIKQMLSELKQVGLLRLGITGGEPLIRKDIGKILEFAKQLGIQTTLVTNGSLVKERIKELKSLNLLIVSLEGPKKIHDNLRGNGTFEKAIEAITITKENNIPVWIETVLTKGSEEKLDFLVSLSDELECGILFQPIFSYPLAATKNNLKKLSPDKEEYTQIINRVIHLKKQGRQIVGSYSYFNWIKEHWPNDVYPNCKAGKLFCCISPGGNVAPCHFLLNAKEWPNGRNMGFAKAFKMLKDNSCSGCFCNSYIETNLLFSKKTIEPKLNFMMEFSGLFKH